MGKKTDPRDEHERVKDEIREALRKERERKEKAAEKEGWGKEWK